MKYKILFFFLVILSLNFIIALPNDANNRIDFTYPAPYFDNNTASVNTSTYAETANTALNWFTDDGGLLGDVGDIDHNLLNNLAWSVAGHTMDADLDMNSFDITEVNDITIENDAQINNELTVDGGIKSTDNIEIWGSYFLKWLDNGGANTYAYIMASVTEFKIA